jgi:predicted Holliday junction resolvase-like endonuclease
MGVMELKIDNASIERLVQEHIKIAVAGVLSKQSDVLVAKLVEHALAQKRPGSYSSYDKPIIEEQINEMIRSEATAACKEWLDSKRPEIRKLVFAALAKKSDGLVAKVVEQLVVGLSEKLYVDAYLRSKE